ncbi:MAG: hypothetical protein ACO1OF_16440 [Adhaeribacter sp.]
MKAPARKMHMNPPQLFFELIMAQINIVLWGRATGKTEGPMARFTLTNLYKMPRSNGFLLGTTYEQLMTRTLPPLFAAWEKFGYRKNEHYWVGKAPPAKYKIPKAFRTPETYDHYIQFNNGSGIYLVSQDRPGTINGVRTQWGAGDEAKLLNKEKLDNEVMLTMAGQAEHFGHLSNYLSLLFCSDMPTTSKGNWLFDYQEQMDPDIIEAILQVQVKLMELQDQLAKAKPGNVFKIEREIAKFQEYLNELRKGTVYVSLASTLDNIHALGIEAIKQFKRILSDITFKISVLNKRIYAVENGFYGLLDEDVFGYHSVNYSFIEGLGLEIGELPQKDCRWDADIIPGLALDISCDYNSDINSVVVGQPAGRLYRFLHSLHVKKKEGFKLRDAVRKFDEYYKYHPTKMVNYYYDHTAIASNASTDLSFADEWTQELENLGWIVNRIYIGQASTHHSRYLLWELIFSQDNRLATFRFNKTNCADWLISCQQAKVKTSGKIWQKDKGSEKDPNVPQEHATHLSEAGDCLIWGTQRHKLEELHDFADTLVM